MKKRVYTVLLCLCLVLTLLPVTAMGSSVTNYDIWVGGVRVTSANKDNITGDGITSGTVTYTPDASNANAGTLTLNDANITAQTFETEYTYGSTAIGYKKAGIHTGNGITNLKIELIGNNHINSSTKSLDKDSSFSIHMGSSSGKLTFTGAGSLTVSAYAVTGECCHSVAVYAESGVTVEKGCTITATCGTATGRNGIAAPMYLNVTLADDVEAYLGNSENDATKPSLTAGNVIKSSTLTKGKYLEIKPAAEVAFDVSVTNGRYTFEERTVDYTDQQSKTFTITNTADTPTGKLTITLSNNYYFELETASVESIANKNGTATFTVKTKTGLPVGDNNTATVTVKNADGTVEKTFNVFFTVSSGTTTTEPTVTIVDGNGNTVTNVKVGDTLYASPSGYPDGTTFTYNWWVMNNASSQTPDSCIDGANGRSYTLTDNEVGKLVGVKVTPNSGTPASSKWTNAVTTGSGSNPDGTTTGTTYYYYTGTSEDFAAPKTADPGVAVYAAMSVMSLLGMGFVQKKRK